MLEFGTMLCFRLITASTLLGLAACTNLPTAAPATTVELAPAGELAQVDFADDRADEQELFGLANRLVNEGVLIASANALRRSMENDGDVESLNQLVPAYLVTVPEGWQVEQGGYARRVEGPGAAELCEHVRRIIGMQGECTFDQLGARVLLRP